LTRRERLGARRHLTAPPTHLRYSVPTLRSSPSRATQKLSSLYPNRGIWCPYGCRVHPLLQDVCSSTSSGRDSRGVLDFANPARQIEGGLFVTALPTGKGSETRRKTDPCPVLSSGLAASSGVLCHSRPSPAHPRPPAQHYDVTAILRPHHASLSAVAKGNSKAQEVTSARGASNATPINRAASSLRPTVNPRLCARHAKSADSSQLANTWHFGRQRRLIFYLCWPWPRRKKTAPSRSPRALNRGRRPIFVSRAVVPSDHNFTSNATNRHLPPQRPGVVRRRWNGKISAPRRPRGRNAVEGKSPNLYLEVRHRCPHAPSLPALLQLKSEASRRHQLKCVTLRAKRKRRCQKFRRRRARSTTMFSDMFGPLPAPGIHRRPAPGRTRCAI